MASHGRLPETGGQGQSGSPLSEVSFMPQIERQSEGSFHLDCFNPQVGCSCGHLPQPVIQGHIDPVAS